MNSYYYQRDSSIEKIPAFNDKLEDNKRSINRIIKYTLIGVLSLILINYLYTDSFITSNKSEILVGNDFLQSINNSTASFSFSVTDKNYPPYGSIDLLPWDMIVEPYKNQTLTISRITIDGNSENISLLNDYEIVWKICDNEYKGLNVSLFMNATGVYNGKVTVSKTSENDIISWTQEFKLAAKYIRREIRNLTTTDRENYFKALHILYELNDTVGKEKYGRKFRSAESFLVKHLTGAGDIIFYVI